MSRHHRRKSHHVTKASTSLSNISVTPISETNITSPTPFLQKVIIFLFHALLLSVPFIFTWVNEELFEFNKMVVTYAFTILIAGVWFARMVQEKKLLFRRTPFDIAIGFFLISQLLSTVFSIHPRTSVLGYYTRFNGGLLSTVSYITLFYAFIHNVQKRHLKPLLITLFVAAIGSSLYAIPEHFGYSPSCVLISTARSAEDADVGIWRALSPSMLGANFNVECWQQDVKTRVFGTFGQPNWLAAYAITLLPLSVMVVLTATKIWGPLQIVSFLASITLLWTLIFTKSRSGVGGFAMSIAMVAGGVFLFWLRKHQITGASTVFSKKNVLALGSISLLFLASLLYFGTPFTPNYGERWIESLSKPAVPVTATTDEPDPFIPAPPEIPKNRLEEGGTDSWEIRKIVWNGAVKVWQRYPLFGSGVETFAYSYYKDRPVEHNLVSEWDFLYNKAHNEFLNYLATTGLVGLIAYCLLLTFLIGYPSVYFLLTLFPEIKKFPASKFVLRYFPHKQDSATALFGLAVSAGLVALSISNLYGFSTVMVCILLFLLPAFFYVEARTPEEELTARLSSYPDENETQAEQIIGYTFLVILMTWLLFATYSLWKADTTFHLGKNFVRSGYFREGLALIEDAVDLSPAETHFYDELTVVYAAAASSLHKGEQATAAAQMALQTHQTTKAMLELNPVNLNLYKTSVRVYEQLQSISPEYVNEKKRILDKAHDLGPSDPKILYYLASTEIELGMVETGIKHLEELVKLKANYEPAHLLLAEQYARTGQKEKARERYEYVLKYLQPTHEKAKRALEAL